MGSPLSGGAGINGDSLPFVPRAIWNASVAAGYPLALQAEGGAQDAALSWSTMGWGCEHCTHHPTTTHHHRSSDAAAPPLPQTGADNRTRAMLPGTTGAMTPCR